MFVDEAQICVKGGSGGNGCISFHREKYRPRGGPDGGNGGRGGDVVIVADSRTATLADFQDRIHWKAEAGKAGSSSNRRGRNGRHLIVRVPPGTVVKDLEGVVWADLANPGDRLIACRGGAGGRGNASFATPRRRLPSFCELGQEGEERWYRLELKLLADVGLVGMPNAGKSSLLRRISRAKPRVAAYPFTTTEPVLGAVEVDDVEFVVADIPGLIEGAASGKGLGDRFLKHVERCRVLVILLDLACSMGPDPEAQEEILLRDLSAYSAELLDRERIVVANKIDLDTGAFEKLAERRPDILGVSAMTGEGVENLLRLLAARIAALREKGSRRPSYLLYRPRPGGFIVERTAEGFRVSGPIAERLARLHPFDSKDALAYLQEVLERSGIERALIANGIEDGDVVWLAGKELVWAEGTKAIKGNTSAPPKGETRHRLATESTGIETLDRTERR